MKKKIKLTKKEAREWINYLVKTQKSGQHRNPSPWTWSKKGKWDWSANYVPWSKQMPCTLVLGLTSSKDSQKVTVCVTKVGRIMIPSSPDWEETGRPGMVLGIKKSLALESDVPDLNPSWVIRSGRLTSQNFLILKMWILLPCRIVTEI